MPPPIGEGPFHRAPVGGHQQIGADLPQNPAEQRYIRDVAPTLYRERQQLQLDLPDSPSRSRR